MTENEIKKEESTTDSNGAGIQRQADSIVDKATIAAERLESAIQKREELLAREEALYSRQLLSGRAGAGQPILTKEQEQNSKAQELANEITKAFK